jgi:RNA polymerase sigma-70 factor, ECF subfamily
MAAHEADEPSDDHLMARVVQRDQAAYARLLSRHLGSIHRYLARMTNLAEADDLAQETFLRLWQHAASYRPGTARLTTWLHRIAHNLAVDDIRKRRLASDLAQDIGVDEVATQPGADPQMRLAADQTRRRLDQALASLPPNQRSALLLCQVQGLSNSDAAVVLGVSVHSVESLVARGRRSLRTRLQQADIMEPEQSKP